MGEHQHPLQSDSKRTERIKLKRDEIVKEHSELATEHHTVWHARSQDADPPCLRSLQDLKRVRLGNLRSQNHGSVLLVRAIEQPIQLGPLFPVMNVVEDITNDVSHMEIFFSSTSPPAAILTQGTVFAIKEPLYVMNHGKRVVRVVQPSNVKVLKPGHDMFPRVFAEVPPLVTKTGMVWAKEGNNALEMGEYSRSVDCFTSGLETHPKNDELRHVLYRSRATAAFHAGQYDLAMADALLSLSAPGNTLKSTDCTALRCAGDAAYQLREFSQARAIYQRLLSILPADIQGLGQLRKIEARIHEETTGAYNFTALLEDQTLADHATFINRTEVQDSEGHGRGVFAKYDIVCGEIIFCEKAFTISHPPPQLSRDHHSISSTNYYGGCGKGVAALWLHTVQKLYANPSLARPILTLYGGTNYSSDADLPYVDGQIAIDVFQILQIIDHNVYGFEAGHAQQPYGSTKYSSNEERESVGLFAYASYLNHSCLNNTSRSIIGDMMLVRASKPIRKGTEITTTYLSPGIGEPGRTAELNRIWKFHCDCKLCAAEIACNTQWKPIFDEVRSHRLPQDLEDPALLEDRIHKAQTLIGRVEENYSTLNGLPRVALRELQEILMVSNSRLGRYNKSYEHALCLLRESGYQISTEASQVRMDFTNGVPTRGVVDALYLLAKQEQYQEVAKQFLLLAKQMYLTLNGTSNAWDVAYGELVDR
ncbi:SET domain-containing protein [Aureobasidium pullulans]|nr:SET domain-containing protein [Aureobasidium pullulans]TIA81444.1 SET domain-containing protein [Aureobasidium pullulans]